MPSRLSEYHQKIEDIKQLNSDCDTTEKVSLLSGYLLAKFTESPKKEISTYGQIFPASVEDEDKTVDWLITNVKERFDYLSPRLSKIDLNAFKILKECNVDADNKIDFVKFNAAFFSTKTKLAS